MSKEASCNNKRVKFCDGLPFNNNLISPCLTLLPGVWTIWNLILTLHFQGELLESGQYTIHRNGMLIITITARYPIVPLSDNNRGAWSDVFVNFHWPLSTVSIIHRFMNIIASTSSQRCCNRYPYWYFHDRIVIPVMPINMFAYDLSVLKLGKNKSEKCKTLSANQHLFALTNVGSLSSPLSQVCLLVFKRLSLCHETASSIRLFFRSRPSVLKEISSHRNFSAQLCGALKQRMNSTKQSK